LAATLRASHNGLLLNSGGQRRRHGGSRTDQMTFGNSRLLLLAACLEVPLSGCVYMHTLASDERPFVVHSKVPQEMTLIHSGMSALKTRLEMIERAQKSIEVEVFIYDIDRTARLISQALNRKARAGVRVRVLVDHSFTEIELNRYYVTELMKNGVKVRYYNRAPLWQIVSQQFRSHRKTLIIDDREAMTGGRNFADNYFDLGENYNFLDTDILVKGTVAEKIRESFDAFWNHKLAVKPEPIMAPVKPKYPQLRADQKRRSATYEARLNRYKRESAKAHAFFVESDEDRTLLAKIANYVEAKQYANVTATCYDTTYVADAPGVGRDTRAVYEQIKEDARKTEKSNRYRISLFHF
jgi:cardiolipin synthase C